MKAFVISPDMPKQQIESIIHFYHIGQFDILIMLNVADAYKQQLEGIDYVIHFDLPQTYNQYKQAGGMIQSETGAMISLACPEQEQEHLLNLQRKLLKAFHRPEMFKCLPVMWHELVKMKSRVDEVTATLSNKRVKDEKLIEFKKQVVTNKSLREYFKQNPSEKEIL